MMNSIPGDVGPTAASSLLRILLHDSHQDTASLLAAHKKWGRLYVPDHNSDPGKFVNDLDPNRRLRVGYIGGEFSSLAASFFLLPLLKFRNRDQFETICYHSAEFENDVTREFASLTDTWRKIAQRASAQAAAQIRSDKIDILVDIAGHYQDNRFDVFAKRAAPIQITYPNYPSTTGVSAIEYIVTDQWVFQGDSEPQYTEKPILLPCGYLSYLPRRKPALSSLPALANGFVTFGIFQRPAKFSERFWDSVSEVLRRTPNSALTLQHLSAEMDTGDPANEYYLSLLTQYGVDAGRVSTYGTVAADETMEMYAKVDIALDTFPYNGQTTTCECLWMGVPVITLAGKWHSARVGQSILSTIGAESLVAKTAAEFVEKAIQLARDVRRLVHYRGTLRRQMLNSPLMDGTNVIALEQEYRRLWRSWCAQKEWEKTC
jgi:predicted O-linked N-acetylglucosamine transferase (SPINDLY family)